MEIDISVAAATLTALGVIFGAAFAAHRWFLKQEKQDADIRCIKEEQGILVHGVLACLKGLKEQGCNGPVSEAIERIETHINTQAHK